MLKYLNREVYMRYNDDLFNVSSQYYSKIDSEIVDNVDEKTFGIEKELLTILLKKFRNTFRNKNIQHNGLLKIKLSVADEGYTQIK